MLDDEKRLEAFEKMLTEIQRNYETAENKMKQLKAEGKEKSSTYRQLLGNNLQFLNLLSLY